MNLFLKRNSLNNIYNKQLFMNIIKISPLRHIKKSFLDFYELYNLSVFLRCIYLISTT